MRGLDRIGDEMRMGRMSGAAWPPEEGRHAVSKFRRAVRMKIAIKDSKRTNIASKRDRLKTPHSVAGGINVVDADRDVAVSVAQFVVIHVPVVGQLDDGVIRLVTVTDKSECKFMLWIFMFT